MRDSSPDAGGGQRRLLEVRLVGALHAAQPRGREDRFVYLRQDYPLIDFVDSVRADGRRWLARACDRRPPSVRLARRRRTATSCFRCSAGRRRPHDLPALPVARARSTSTSSLLDANELAGALSREQLAYGIYFGCVIMLLVWSGFVFIAVRDRAFLAYFAYVGDVRHLHDGQHRPRVSVSLARQSALGQHLPDRAAQPLADHGAAVLHRRSCARRTTRRGSTWSRAACSSSRSSPSG